MIRFEVERIKGNQVFVRLLREGMSDSLLVFFKEGDHIILQPLIKQHDYTCDLIGPRDRRYYPREGKETS